MANDDDVTAVNPANASVMKDQQKLEAKGRQRQETIEVTDGLGDDAIVDDTGGDGRLPADPGDTDTDARRAPERTLSEGDQQRQDIYARFRQRRNSTDNEASEDAREIKEFINRGGLPKEFSDVVLDYAPTEGDEGGAPRDAGLSEDEVAEQEAQEERRRAAAAAPEKHKIKVNGREEELTLEQLIERVQKSDAADERLEEAKELARELKQIKRDLETRGSTSGTPADQSTGTDGTRQPAADATPAPDLYQETIEAIQYGDTATAIDRLKKLVTTAVPQIAQQTSLGDRRNAELSRARSVVQRFERDNADLASDPIAQGAIRTRVFAHQRQDLMDYARATGRDPNKIPTDENSIANLHLTLRSDPMAGASMRTTDQILDAAKGDFIKWRDGFKPPAPTPAADGDPKPNPQPKPAIRVSVDRDDRRRLIPTQPSRTTIVRRPTPTAPPPKTRSEVIMEMRKARGQTT